MNGKRIIALGLMLSGLTFFGVAIAADTFLRFPEASGTTKPLKLIDLGDGTYNLGVSCR